MGIFDQIGGLFSGSTAQTAADQQVAGLNAAYGQASDLLGQGRGALTTNYAAALAPFTQNYADATKGTTAYGNALGLNGPAGNAAATANFQKTPGYDFTLNQGTENVLRNASRTGSLASGNTNADLTNYASGLANNTYQQYLQNLQPYLNSSNTAASGIAGVDTGLGNTLNASYGTQANAAYGTQAGIGNAQANATLAQNAGAQNLLGLGSNLLKAGTSIFSDERLKEDIEKIGQLNDGQNIYRYRYIGDDTPRIGLMAQEVEERHPDAVTEIGGFKAVDYGKATQFASKLAEFL